MSGFWHKATVFMDQVLDGVRAYIEGLAPDQLEMHFLGLMAIGFILALYLLYSIYRRTNDYRIRVLKASGLEAAPATGLAELLRDRERLPEDQRKKKLDLLQPSAPQT